MKRFIQLAAALFCCAALLLLSACANGDVSTFAICSISPSNTSDITIGNITLTININKALGDEAAIRLIEDTEPEHNDNSLGGVTITSGGNRLKLDLKKSSGMASFNYTSDLVDAIIQSDYNELNAQKLLEACEYKPLKKLKRTIMIYMCGTDLESDDGFATLNLDQILGLDIDDSTTNVMVFTGGTKNWQNDYVPSKRCAISIVDGGEFLPLTTFKNVNMGDAGTLAGFVNFCMGFAPAEKYQLVLWDHGFGTSGMLGSDEYFDGDGLTVAELKNGLHHTKLSTQKLEFIGFDACLMASADIAYILRDYADFMVASEESVPAGGWDYSFIEAVSKQPNMSVEKLCRKIVDDFIAQYNVEDMSTLSVIKTSKTPALIKALGALYRAAGSDLSGKTFRTFAKIRNNTKAFGTGGQRGENSDMVDIIDLAAKFSDSYPKLANAVADAANDAVVYSNTTFVKNAYGISTLFPYENKGYSLDEAAMFYYSGIDDTMAQYLTKFSCLLEGYDPAAVMAGKPSAQIDTAWNSELAAPVQDSDDEFEIRLTKQQLEDMREIYYVLWQPTEESEDFCFQVMCTSEVEIDDDGTIVTKFDGMLPMLGDYEICIYEYEYGEDYALYTIPVQYNGNEADLLLMLSDEYPDGKIIGVQTYAPQAGRNLTPGRLRQLKKGDKLAFEYYAELLFEDGNLPKGYDDEEWFAGDTFTYDGKGLKLGFTDIQPGTYFYGFNVVDVYGNDYYTDIMEITFE